MSIDIKEILHKNYLFKHLSDEDILKLCQEGQIKEFAANETIIREGEIGDLLYILVSGTARVFTHNVKNEEINLTRLQKGDYFGEQALLTPKPLRRNASVEAVTAVSVIIFNHDVLQKCLKMNKGLKVLLEEYGQRQLVTKPSKQLQDRSTSVKELFSLFEGIENFRPNEVIFKKGDKANQAYLLLNGSVEIKLSPIEEEKNLASLIVPGQIFGEKAIIQNDARAGTAIALNDVKVMVINGQQLREIYAKNMQLNILLSNLMWVYELPTLGLMTRYSGSFLGQSAVQTNILKNNNEMIVISHVANARILGMRYAENEIDLVKHEFQKDEHLAREIHLKANKLVGVISIGSWDDLSDIYRLLDTKITLSEDMIDTFKATGKITSPAKSAPQNLQDIHTILSKNLAKP